MSYYFSTRKGKRSENQDAHSIILNMNGANPNYNKVDIYAIYDGHGNKHVSEYLMNVLYKYLLSPKLTYPLTKAIADSIFTTVNNNIALNLKKESVRGGSTAMCAIRYKANDKEYMNILNLGDCRMLVCKANNEPIQLTRDHRPDDIDEYLRIKTAGGELTHDGTDWRVCGLSVSRSFGDFDCYPYISHKPDVIVYEIEPTDKYIILMCDGAVESLSNHDIVDFITSRFNHCNKPCKCNIADKLTKYAIDSGSGDNVSVIIIPLAIKSDTNNN